MAQLFYGSMQRQGVNLQYYRTGGEKPPVIMLHGLTDNALCWNRIPVLLEVEFDVVLLDARGHGLSGLDACGASLDVQADDVLALIDQLELLQPVLIGHSMGAVVAALIAARMPKAVRGVVLIDPPWRDEAEIKDNGKERYPESVRAGFRENKNSDLAALMARGRADNPCWDESEFMQWAKSKQQFTIDALDTIKVRDFPWFEVMPQLKCPGLLLTGDPKLGAVITPALARKIGRIWKKGKVVFIPGAGHSIHRDQFGAVMVAIDDFMRRLGKWKPEKK